MRQTTLPCAEAATWVDLGEGDEIAGTVLRLPVRGQPEGTRLFLRASGGEVVAISAVARRGWSMLERALDAEAVQVGDLVSITFLGWRETMDGERRYRHVRLNVLGRAPGLGQVA